MRAQFVHAPATRAIIATIAERAQAYLATVPDSVKYPTLDMEMDLACAKYTCPAMNLEKLLAFSDFEFMHDIYGIRSHLNRTTGQIEGFFLPRCARGNATTTTKEG